MSSPLYDWFFHEPFHSIFLGCTTSLSLFSNGLLLYIIATTNSSNLGPYRYLLAVFAVCDIVTTMGHAGLQAVLFFINLSLLFTQRSIFLVFSSDSFDTIFCLIFIATYYQTFLILAYHFIYRYKTVTSSISRSFTDSWSRTRWIALGVVVYIIYVGGVVGGCAVALTPTEYTRANVPAEIMELYGVDLRDKRAGFTVAAVKNAASGEMEWHPLNLSGLICCVALFGATAIVIIFCIYKTSAAIRSTENNLSEKTRQMQKNLFHALLIQTAVPCFFSYLPLATILVFPAITGISLGAFGNVLFSTTAIFPSIDPFFVLFFIKRFREAVVRLF
ncbi:hypothetical protein PFISCL1PPCAC_12719, partial [Pristionchus fissidentatus]